MESILCGISDLLRRHTHNISIAIVATILALYGSRINETVRNTTKDFHLPVRFCLFVFLCTFGYGMLSLFASKLLEHLLVRIGDLYFGLSVAAAFLILGLLAEHHKKI